jgi:hypothetical protein
VHPKLTKAARAHSVDMIRRDYLATVRSGLGSSATGTTARLRREHRRRVRI